MPVVILDQADSGPAELAAQLPVRAELVRVLPGPDRPDYCLALLEKRLVFKPGPDFDVSRVGSEFLRTDTDGSPAVLVYAVVFCARFQGTQVAPDMKDLWVNLAYVIDNSQMRDGAVDFAKLENVAVARINLDPTIETLRQPK
ncbi:hypothetical protein [Rhodococcus oryzae]|uniref:hypothetical protein n=1 Tax=Rhodococcus oryzae TaxID=2571143 RepID=UPI0037A60840